MQQRTKQALLAASLAPLFLLVGVYARPVLIIEANHFATDAGFADIQMARSVRPKKQPTPPPTALSVYTDTFSTPLNLEESGGINSSSSSSWWLSSGGYFYNTDGFGSTVLGSLSTTNPWRVAYYLSNPTDTDGGYHPQNIFRLVTKTAWQNYTQEAYFKTTTVNLSSSSERDAWSGIFFFNRYQDQNNLYYTGIRDDGRAIIKAKKNGIYTTLADKVLWSGIYNRATNPSLLPQNQWVGMKSEVVNLTDNTVSIKFYIDETGNGNWLLVLDVVDSQNPILTSGYGGIRTDFRDIQFDNFKIVKY